MDSTWTITELAEAAAAALDGEPRTVNGRVRDLPNERLIRWYTTIGLVDPPLGRRGRTALYGPRHLMQLVAIKRRQAAGRTIADIQTELAGATDSTLREIARLPGPPATHGPASPASTDPALTDPASADPALTDPALTDPALTDPALTDPDSTPGSTGPAPAAPASAGPASAVADAAGPQSARPVRRFWATRPAPLEPTAEERGTQSLPMLVQGVRLAPGVTLLLDAGELTQTRLAAIGEAARPLLAELRRQGLTPDTTDDPASPTESPGRPS